MVENVKELLRLHEGITHEVYLDNENSSIVPKEVVDAMLPYFNKTAYGNPTLTHKPGWEAFEVIMNSFKKISLFIVDRDFLGCKTVFLHHLGYL